jgi:hypothetical protein
VSIMSAEVSDSVKASDGGNEMLDDLRDDLRTAAILVCHLEREEKGQDAWAAMLEAKAEESRRMERFRAELHRIIGKRDDISFRVNGGCVEAEVEDLRFAALEYPASKKRSEMTLVTLLGRCPLCGVETMSEPLYNFAGLGKMLENFEPMREHFCPSRLRSKPGE